MNICSQLTNILGKPNEGVHKYRLLNGIIPGGIAIIDVVLTFVLARLIQVYSPKSTSYLVILTGCFITGIILHRICNVRTTVDKILFQ